VEAVTMADTATANQRSQESFHSFIIKVNNVCNLACTYCYYMVDAPRKGTFVSDHALERLFQQIRLHSTRERPVTFYWHGGEPLLIERARFVRLLEMQRDYLSAFIVRNSVQTNAMNLSREWIEIFRDYHIGLGVSIDGTQQLHDKHRVDHRGRGSYERVVSKSKLALEAGLRPKCLVVINPEARGDDVMRNIAGIGFKRVDFLLPMRNWNCGDEALSVRCGRFLIEAFRAYLQLADSELDVTLFSSLRDSLTGGTPERCMCHNSCHGVLTIEPSGRVGLCDDLKPVGSDLYLLPKNIMEHGLPEIMTAVRERYAEHRINDPISKGSFWDVPLNWCPATRYGKGNGFRNRSVDFVPIAMLMNEISNLLSSAKDAPFPASSTLGGPSGIVTHGAADLRLSKA
jgi:sulfatase maturation enzyme AslB (radical SAM superfamily)